MGRGWGRVAGWVSLMLPLLSLGHFPWVVQCGKYRYTLPSFPSSSSLSPSFVRYDHALCSRTYPLSRILERLWCLILPMQLASKSSPCSQCPAASIRNRMVLTGDFDVLAETIATSIRSYPASAFRLRPKDASRRRRLLGGRVAVRERSSCNLRWAIISPTRERWSGRV